MLWIMNHLKTNRHEHKPTKFNSHLRILKTLYTRKSSCVTARGIPPAAYPALALLSRGAARGGGYPSPNWGGGGTPVPARGYPSLRKDLGPETRERTWNWGTPKKGPGTRERTWDWGTPLWTDRLTSVKTLPSRRTTCAGDNW